MKKWVLISVVVIGFSPSVKVTAQAQEVQQLLLNVEKLAQLKNILSDLKKGYQIVSSGYGAIKNISEGNFNLHQAFLDRLLEVSPVVRNYKRVADIISTEVRLVAECKKVFRQFRESKNFTAVEMDYMAKVYANLFNQSLKNLDALAKVVTAGQLRMSDDERFSAIDTIWKEVEDSYTFLKHFNNSAKVLALQRMKEQRDVSGIKNLYNIH
jgi:hypothetical protein